MQEVHQTIADALKNNQRVIVLANQQQDKSRRWWDIAQLAVPALLTRGVALLVWLTQINLTNKITAMNQVASTRYALTQEYKKEQFKAYQRAMWRLTALESTVAGASHGAEGKHNAMLAKHMLDEELAQSQFYFNPTIYTEIDDISFDTGQLQAINPHGSRKTNEVMTRIADLKKKIQAEATGELGQLGSTKSLTHN